MKLLSVSFILFLLFLFTGCETDAPTSTPQHQVDAQSDLQNFQALAKGGPALRVMTRNIYIGADVDKVLSAENPEDIPLLTAQAFQQLIATNFPGRAISLANEIALTKPDLIGLQEVTLLRLQSPGDAVVGGTQPAVDTLINYLDVLVATLQAYGLDYKVAALVENADVELPMVTGVDPLTFDDIRVTDFDVILARDHVEVSDVTAKNFAINLVIPDLNTEILRGYCAVDATVGPHTYRFVNTHLEAFAAEIRLAQISELLTDLSSETLPIVMLGDFNSPAPQGPTYNAILSAGYTDLWTQNRLQDDPTGHTFGHDAGLRNPVANFTERIDHIYVKSELPLTEPVIAIVVGDEPFNRTASGLWPSDHGGVVARFALPLLPPGRLARVLN